MKTILLLPFLVLSALLPLVAAAQGDAEDCQQCICIEDITCSDIVCDNTQQTGDCHSYSLKPLCTTQYTLKIELICSDPAACANYCAYTMITAPDGSLTASWETECTSNGCSSTTPVNLDASVRYTWRVCLRVCPGAGHACFTPSGCKARATLFTSTSASCPDPCY